MKEVFHRSALLCLHEEDADEAQEDAHGGNNHRCDDSLELHVAIHGKGCSTQCGRRKNTTAVAFIQVGSHTGHISYVVSYVVGNRCRVAGIVFGDVCLYFTYQVGTYVGRFGIDTTAYTCEQSLGRGSHSERKHGGGNGY